MYNDLKTTVNAIKHSIVENIKHLPEYDEHYIDTEKAFRNISKQIGWEIVDAYGSFIGNISGKRFICLNTYGEEDNWREATNDSYFFTFCLLFEDSVIVVEVDKKENSDIETRYIEQSFDVKLNLLDFGCKRGFYFEPRDGRVRMRTTKEFYNTLPEKYKCKECESDLSDPHFTIRFL